jgi:hypothetical protein
MYNNPLSGLPRENIYIYIEFMFALRLGGGGNKLSHTGFNDNIFLL